MHAFIHLASVSLVRTVSKSLCEALDEVWSVGRGRGLLGEEEFEIFSLVHTSDLTES